MIGQIRDGLALGPERDDPSRSEAAPAIK